MSNGVCGHMSKNAETDCMLCLFVSMVPLFGFAAFFVVIAVFATPLVGVSFAVIHFGEKSSTAQGGRHLGVVNCGEKSSNAEGGACLGVIRGAVVTQKAREEVFPDDEVRAVVKTGITVAAQAEFVLIILHTTLFVSKFDSGSMAGTGDNTGSNCRSRSGIPVVSRKGRHRSSGVSEAGFTLCIKVFHFFGCAPPPPPPPPHPTHQHKTGSSRARVIQPGSSSQGHPARVIQPGSSSQGHPARVIN
jgi:hypothetical protein